MSLPPSSPSSPVHRSRAFDDDVERDGNSATSIPGPQPYLLSSPSLFPPRGPFAHRAAFGSKRGRHERKGIKLALYCSLCAPWDEPGSPVRLEFPRRVDSRRCRRPRRFPGGMKSGEIYTGALPRTRSRRSPDERVRKPVWYNDYSEIQFET